MGLRNVEAELRGCESWMWYVFSAHFDKWLGIFLGPSMLTGGLLHSCLHRVGPLPGRTREERYSFAYLQRAEDDARVETLPGISDYATDKSNDEFTSRVLGRSVP